MNLSIPQGFTYLSDKRIQQDIRYASAHNFTGRQVLGYIKPRTLLTLQANTALTAVQDALSQIHPHYYLKIFDAYRPTQAVQDFIDWGHAPEDYKTKAHYYPTLDKVALFDLGYLAKGQSTHSRGSTVDLTICTLDNSNFIELEMGTQFDYFDPRSHMHASNISVIAQDHRALLLEVMAQQGFINYPTEWWHFTLDNEPFPDTYFDFPVT